MAKRTYKVPHGEGAFYQAANGRWMGVLERGWTERGTRDRKVVSSYDKDKAWDKFMAARKQAVLGEPVAPQAPTVKAWSEQWLENLREHVRPGTYDMQRSRVKAWIVPTLGTKRLDKLTPADVRLVQAKLDEAGRSQSTKRNVHACLLTMLNAAVDEGHAVPLTVRRVRKPAEPVATRDAIPLEDALRLVRVASERPDAARWVAALMQGMRQGECLGLTWEAVDLENRTIDVSWQLVQLRYEDKAAKRVKIPPGYEVRHLIGTRYLARPKSAAGKRIVKLVPWMHDALLAWRDVAPSSPYGLVWPRPDGKPQQPDEDRAAWYALCDAAAVWKVPPAGDTPPVRYLLHEARHTAASLLLAAGVDPQVVRTIMGWTSEAMRRTYTHASPEVVLDALSRSAAKLQLEGA